MSATAVSQVTVVGVGAIAGPGKSARQVVVGRRAGAASPARREVGDPLRAVRVLPSVAAQGSSWRERVVSLGALALSEAATTAFDVLPEGTPLVLALGPPLGPDAEAEAAGLVAEIAGRAGVAVDLGRSTTVWGEYGAGALALGRAFELLSAPRGPSFVVLGGIDCRTTTSQLLALLASGRVRAIDDDEEAPLEGGITPGEAAAFVVLAREELTRSAELSLQVWGALSRPTAVAFTELELVGELVGPLLVAESESPAVLVCEVNGETWRTRAWSDALAARRALRPQESMDLEALCVDLGDLGAATFATAVVLSLVSARASASVEPVWVGVLERELAQLALVTPTAGRWPAWVQAPVASLPEARALSRGLRRVSERFRAVRHRLPVAQRPILSAALERCESTLESLTVVDADAMSRHERASEAAGALGASVEAATRSARRRGRELEPAVADIAALVPELVAGLSRLRLRLVELMASLPEPAATGSRPELPPFVLQRGWLGGLPLPATGVSAGATPSELVDAVDEEEELDEDEPESSLAMPRPADDEALVDALETLGRLMRTRTPSPDGAWAPELAELDRLVLAQVDWLLSLAYPFAVRPPHAEAGVDLVACLVGPESPLESTRALADTLLLASSSRREHLRKACDKCIGAHPELVDPLIEGLSLASAASLEPELAELCLEDDEQTLRIALEVMRRRREVQIGAVAPLLYDPRVSVRTGAALSLGHASDREAAILCLESRLATELDASVVAALIESVVRQRAPHAEGHVARALGENLSFGEGAPPATRDARAVLVRCAAVLGRTQELPAIVAVSTRPLELEALGWFGRVTLVDPLVRMLERPDDDEPRRRAAARSLSRILGAVPERGPKGTRLVAGALSTVRDEDLCVEPAAWRAYWELRGSEFGAGVRYRFGRRLEPAASATEHVASGVLHRDRAWTALELAAAGQPDLAPADERDWVARQLAALQR